MKENDVEWWVMKRAKNTDLLSFYDGPHSDIKDCEKALYIWKRLGKSIEDKVICKIEIFPPSTSGEGVNEEAIDTLNKINK